MAPWCWRHSGDAGPVRTGRQRPVRVGCALALGLAGGLAAAGDPALPEPLAAIEAPRMASLAGLQAGRQAPPRPFVSDGCSGGMSRGWALLAAALPALADEIGPRPPWEGCCYAHDVLYWAGPAVDGLRLRLEGDRALRRCVVALPEPRLGEWSRRLGLPVATLRLLLARVAELMYAAVRLGGGPCTGLPWRWGYGWPRCGGAPAAGAAASASPRAGGGTD